MDCVSDDPFDIIIIVLTYTVPRRLISTSARQGGAFGTIVICTWR